MDGQKLYQVIMGILEDRFDVKINYTVEGGVECGSSN